MKNLNQLGNVCPAATVTNHITLQPEYFQHRALVFFHMLLHIPCNLQYFIMLYAICQSFVAELVYFS